MKKLFTLLAATVVGLAAYAQSYDATVRYQSGWNYIPASETTVTVTGDGQYTIADFFGEDYPNADINVTIADDSYVSSVSDASGFPYQILYDYGSYAFWYYAAPDYSKSAFLYYGEDYSIFSKDEDTGDCSLYIYTYGSPFNSDYCFYLVSWKEPVNTLTCDYALGYGNYLRYVTLNEWVPDGEDIDYQYELVNPFGTGSEYDVLRFNVNDNNQIEWVGLDNNWIYYDGSNCAYVYDGYYSYADITDTDAYIYYYLYGDAGNGYVFITNPLTAKLSKTWKCDFATGDYSGDESEKVLDGYRTVEQWADANFTYAIDNLFGTGADNDRIEFNINEANQMELVGLRNWSYYYYMRYGADNEYAVYIYSGDYAYAYVSDDYIYIRMYVQGSAYPEGAYLYITYPLTPKPVEGEDYSGMPTAENGGKYARVAFCPVDLDNMDSETLAYEEYWNCSLQRYYDSDYEWQVSNLFREVEDALQFNLVNVEAATWEDQPYLVEVGDVDFYQVGGFETGVDAYGKEYKKIEIAGEHYLLYEMAPEQMAYHGKSYTRFEGGLIEGSRVTFLLIKQGLCSIPQGYYTISWGVSNQDFPSEPELVETKEAMVVIYDMYDDENQNVVSTDLNVYDNGVYEVVNFLGEGYEGNVEFTIEGGYIEIANAQEDEDGDEYITLTDTADASDFMAYVHAGSRSSFYGNGEYDLEGVVYEDMAYFYISLPNGDDYDQDIVTIYWNKKEGTDAITGINADSEEPIEYYNLSGIRVENPTPGIYIIRQGARVTKAIIR